jgi:hypothetical protein
MLAITARAMSRTPDKDRDQCPYADVLQPDRVQHPRRRLGDPHLRVTAPRRQVVVLVTIAPRRWMSNTRA